MTNNANRTTIFLMNFFAGFIGFIMVGIVVVSLFPVGVDFNRLVIPSLVGPSFIIGIIMGLNGLTNMEKQVLEERVKQLETQLKNKK